MTNAEAAARSTMAAYSGDGPVSFPIDPVAIARSLGINVYQSTLENTLSGMIARLTPDSDVDIVVNSEHAPVRQRFTIAHELGHFFAIQSDPARSTAPFIHRRDTLAACGTDSEEIFANGYAAELLMPSDEVRRLHATGLDATRLASMFHVSIDAITNRLKNLGLA